MPDANRITHLTAACDDCRAIVEIRQRALVRVRQLFVSGAASQEEVERAEEALQQAGLVLEQAEIALLDAQQKQP